MAPGISNKVYYLPTEGSGATDLDVRKVLGAVIKQGVVNPAPHIGEPAYDLQFRYKKGYEAHLLKGRDVSPRPWNMYDLIKARVSPNAVVTDVGCGTAYKSLKLAPSVKLLVGVEPNEEMIAQAVQNALIGGARNVCFISGNYNELPFEDGSLDLVMGFLAPHSMQEIYRVLKPHGWAVIERVGDRDKVNIKEFFGSDYEGPRGQLLQLAMGERAQKMEKEFRKQFSKVDMQNGFWDTEYTLEELLVLLEHTPSVRDFSLERDRDALERIKVELMIDGRVKTAQNRVLIVAQK